MNDRDLEKAWGKATDALEAIRQELQAIDAERSHFKARREHIMVTRPFGRLEADAVLEDIDRRMQPVIARFKLEAARVHAYDVELYGRKTESPAKKRNREANEALGDF
jgi:hypothetical protein